MEKTQTGTLIWGNGQIIEGPPGHVQRMVWRNGEIVSELVKLETGAVIYGDYSNEPPVPNRNPEQLQDTCKIGNNRMFRMERSRGVMRFLKRESIICLLLAPFLLTNCSGSEVERNRRQYQCRVTKYDPDTGEELFVIEAPNWKVVA